MRYWLGLFAMLMIDVGPLYSAIQTVQAGPHGHHAEHGHHGHHGHHGRAGAGGLAWLAALELCGYCELLTANPPLSLAVQLILPRYQPDHFLPLPEPPLPPSSHC